MGDERSLLLSKAPLIIPIMVSTSNLPERAAQKYGLLENLWRGCLQ
jgi:hypothetical protein